jgi:hypothetical protein
MEDYRSINRANWDERVPAHAASPDYGPERYAADPGHLSQVVRFDLPRLGDVNGLRGVHLQCHIGTDTVSLARLGASMTGLDFSGPAVAQAQRLADRIGLAPAVVQRAPCPRPRPGRRRPAPGDHRRTCAPRATTAPAGRCAGSGFVSFVMTPCCNPEAGSRSNRIPG